MIAAFTSTVAAAIIWLAPAVTEERADAIAADVVAVACPDGVTSSCRRDAAGLLAVAFHESHFRIEVDDGTIRGDAGRSIGLWQIQCGKSPRCSMYLDRRLAAAHALRLIHRSENACRQLGPDAALRVYASGSCKRGAKASAVRVATWERVLNKLD